MKYPLSDGHTLNSMETMYNFPLKCHFQSIPYIQFERLSFQFFCPQIHAKTNVLTYGIRDSVASGGFHHPAHGSGSSVFPSCRHVNLKQINHIISMFHNMSLLDSFFFAWAPLSNICSSLQYYLTVNVRENQTTWKLGPQVMISDFTLVSIFGIRLYNKEIISN